MKKVLALSLTAAMVIAMVTGCGSAGAENGNIAEQAPAAETESTQADEAGEDATDGSGAEDGTTYKIGVLQLTEHAALDAANEGFVAALNDAGISYEIDQQNAQNDQSACQTIAEKLVNDGNDLILAIATPAAQAVAGVTSDKIGRAHV